MQTKIDAFFTYLQSMPLGEHMVAITASGMRVLLVLVLVALCVLVRGRINFYLFSDAEERKRLHDGNPAFVVNQLLVIAAFCIALGATLVNTTNIPAFADKVIVALVIQIVAMLVLRVLFRKAHHQMLHGNMGAGVRLGTITLLVGVVTAFEMMR
jgi:uncharacterized membrane protein YjfL (UPF0719 family)